MKDKNEIKVIIYPRVLSPQTWSKVASSSIQYEDVEIESIKKLTKIFPGKIIINDKIHLSHLYPLPKINSSTVIVNTGSNRLDTLGNQT